MTPVHPRPFLLPDTNKNQLLKLIENKDWAKQDFKHLQQRAQTGDGYSAAFLYALTDDKRYLEQAKSWLIKTSKQGGDLGRRALEVDDDFFKQGMPWLSDVYYETNSKYIEAFDLIYNSLNESEIKIIQKGIEASANFRLRSMDTWWQTANLVFKPTSMVAIAGLVTQNPRLLNWGFFRKPESNLGGYFSALDNMLKDNGPWHEAPTYAMNHLPLYQSLKISNLLSRMTGTDWFDRKLDKGSSIRGLMDYYIDTTYPRHTHPDGSGAYRILTYGDGATGQQGDSYLVTQNSLQRDLTKELTLAYKLSRDPDYASLLKLFDGYQPNLIDQPELPVSPLLPKAKSSIWPDFGLAFLRSDHSRNYWKNPDALATSLLFRQGYGHGHADALSITLFGAGQLFYPDYNAIQYENPAIGWTTSSVAHNTVIVDGNNSSIPKSVTTAHDFDNNFRFMQANVDEPLGLNKKRSLVLSSDYLLDVFHISSLIPRTYDYLLHSFGRIETEDPDAYKINKPFSTRYKNINNFKSSNHNKTFELDFVIDLDKEKQNIGRIMNKYTDKNNTKQKVNTAFGLTTTDSFRAAKTNFKMSGGVNTKIGIGEDEYGLSFFVARREDTKQTTFISLHSPSYLEKESIVTNKMETIIDSNTATLVKVTTDSHIDLHAISHQAGVTTLRDATENVKISFSNYAALRIDRNTMEINSHGNWHGYFISKNIIQTSKDISFGELEIEHNLADSSNTSSLQVNMFPEIVVLKDFSNSEFTLSLTNKTDKALSAHVEFQDNKNYQTPENGLSFGIIPAYRTAHQNVKLGRYKQTRGADLLPLKISIDNSNENSINHGIMVSAGPGLVRLFEDLEDPVYRIHTFDSEVDFSMRNGLINGISKSTKRLFNGDSLFNISDGKTIFSPKTNSIESSYTWADQINSSIISEINNLIRWHLFAIQNRFYIKLDSAYTRIEKVYFVFDKTNKSFDWSTANFFQNGKSTYFSKSNSVNTNAVEIPFKNSSHSLCIKTTEAKNWLNNDESLSFPMSRDEKDQFSFGICPENSLTTWAS